MNVRRSSLRPAGAVGVVLVAALGLTPAIAGSAPPIEPGEPAPGTRVSDSSEYRALSTFWTQVDTAPDGTPVPPGTAPFGNVHVGFLDIYEVDGKTVTRVPGQPKEVARYSELFAWAFIQDFDCPVGTLPPTGGGHAVAEEVAKAVAAEPVVDAAVVEQIAEDVIEDVVEEEPPPAGDCVHVGIRTGESDGIDISLDEKLRTATATGFLLVYGGGDPHGGDPGQVVGRPRVDVVWTGVGDLGKGESSGSYKRGPQKWSYSGASTDRAATMSGILGPMGFDPALSGGTISRGTNEWSQTF